jgi:CRP-like cAMP-binding protein
MKPTPIAVKTVIDTITIKYPRDQMEILNESVPHLDQFLAAKLATEPAKGNDNLVLLHHQWAKVQLAALLLMIAFRNFRGDNHALHLQVSLHDIADYLELSIDKISCELEKLKRQGIIRIGKTDGIMLTDLNALQAIVAASAFYGCSV